MSSRTQKEAIVIAVDCGQSMARKCSQTDQSVFELSKTCVINIIKQKIFAETKNEYLFVEFGNNYDESDVKVNGSLRSPNFDLLRYISQLSPSLTQSNVLEALKVSTNQLIESTKGQKFSALKIAIFTNFGHFSDKDLYDLKALVNDYLKPYEIQLIIMCDFNADSDLSDLSDSQLVGIKAMKFIEEESIGFCYGLEYANNYFSNFECKKTAPIPWYSNLELGKDVNALNIPIVGYIKITEYKKKTGSESYVRPTSSDEIQTSDDNNIEVEQKPLISEQLTETPIEKVVTYRPNDDQSMEELEREEVISAYSYGSTLVPFSEDDKKAFNYQSTEKGFKIIGFASVHDICSAHQIGDKTMFVTSDPRLKQNNHKLVFQALVKGMIEKKEVAIVRYAYRDRSSPQIGYLSPYVEKDKNVFLAYIQLPFDEDVRRYRFPSLESKPQYCPTKPQLEAIDELIDAMDLMNAGVDDEENVCEALQSENIYNPFLQYWFQCLYHRQLHNSNDLPLPSNQLKDSIEPPIKIRENADKILRKVAQKFPLDYIKDKSIKKRNHLNISQEVGVSEPKRVRNSDEDNDQIMIIEKVKSEANQLIESEVPFTQISDRLEDSIKDFCVKAANDELGEHIIDLLKIYRKASVLNNEPNAFNEFMKNFMKPFRGTTLWYLMLSNEIGLIGRSECDISDVSQEEVENFTNLTDDYIKVEIH